MTFTLDFGICERSHHSELQRPKARMRISRSGRPNLPLARSFASSTCTAVANRTFTWICCAAQVGTESAYRTRGRSLPFLTFRGGFSFGVALLVTGHVTFCLLFHRVASYAQ